MRISPNALAPFLLLLAACEPSDGDLITVKETPTKEESPATVKQSAPIRGEQLRRMTDALLYDANQVAVQDQYIGRTCEVSGSVISVEPVDDAAWGPCYYVFLSSGLSVEAFFFPMDIVWVCVFPTSAKRDLVPLSAGNTITIHGEYANWVKNEGELFLRMVLKDCRIRG